MNFGENSRKETEKARERKRALIQNGGKEKKDRYLEKKDS